MARLARVIAVGVPHHVTQRGNARQFILDSDAERAVYFDLLSIYAALHQLPLIGYCLMSNHVHLVTIPQNQESLGRVLKQTHGRYAAYWNARHASSGHVWQGRFYSCPLDEPHLWAALRYSELNPVRARLVARPEDWRWSSAAAHLGLVQPAPFLDMQLWSQHWTIGEWRSYLSVPQPDCEILGLRQCTHTGRPLGSAEFVKELEQRTGRPLAPGRGGRPKTSSTEDQPAFAFDRSNDE